MQYVYKYVLDNYPIYIGITGNLSERISQHSKSGDNIPEYAKSDLNHADIYYAELPNRTMADVFESVLINRYKPKYNKAKKCNWEGIDLPEPGWILFNDKRESRIQELENHICKLKRENELLLNQIANKCELCEYKKKYDRLLKDQEINHSKMIFVSDNAKTFEEIIDLYENGTKNINYASKAYDRFGNLICCKHIFTNRYDQLEFQFEQFDKPIQAGAIYYNRDDRTKKNWQIIRAWLFRGDSLYYPE